MTTGNAAGFGIESSVTRRGPQPGDSSDYVRTPSPSSQAPIFAGDFYKGRASFIHSSHSQRLLASGSVSIELLIAEHEFGGVP